MADTLTDRIRDAVKRGVAARHAYYEAILLPDEQALGEPARLDLVEALERDLGKPLPPSYRTFLLMFDGWRMIDGGTDLFSVAALLPGAQRAEMAEWQKRARAEGDEVAARSLVIGASGVTATKYLLDPEQVDEDGEWALVQHHHEVEAVVPSFLKWLEESVDEYQELARAAHEDSDEG